MAAIHNTVDGIHYTVRGAGPTLVLLHPIGLSGAWWELYGSKLSRNFSVVSIDLRGHGLSVPAAETIEIFDHAHDVSAIIDRVGQPAHVVGVSMGGMIAQTLAVRHPRAVASLCLLSTMATVADSLRPQLAARGSLASSSGMAVAAAETVARWVHPSDIDSPFAKRCLTQLTSDDVGSWMANWGAISRLNILPELGAVQVPTLICTGSEDRSTPPAAAEAIASRIECSELHVLDQIAHMGAFEHPQRFLPLIQKFLRI